MSIRSVRRAVAWGVCLALLGCGKQAGETASVNVLGVNYTAGEFRYRLEDPANAKNAVGGELIDSFSGGGIRCCFELPRQWRPGLKVRIHTTLFELPPPPNDGIENLKEIRHSTDAEVPPYVDDKVGDLWVVRQADGSFGVISSSYQPDHPKWPGAIKGWPVPSLEYRRSRYDIHIDIAEKSLEGWQRYAVEFRKDRPKVINETWKHMWEHANEYASPNSRYEREKRDRIQFLESFSGPADPRFAEWVENHVAATVQTAKEELETLRRGRP